MPLRGFAIFDTTAFCGRFLPLPPLTMRSSSFEFCLPTKATSVPDGPGWLHEVKYDGYRLRLERDGDRVRLITRGGYHRYPWIVEAALKNRLKQFVIDGEAVVLGDGAELKYPLRCRNTTLLIRV